MKKYLLIIPLLFCFIPKAHAAILLVASSSSIGVTTTTIPSTGVGHLLVVATNFSGNGAVVTGVTDNASGGTDTFSQAATSTVLANVDHSEIWYAPNIKSGVTLVTIAYSGINAGSQDIGIMEYSGAATSNPLDVSTANNNANAVTTTMFTATTTTSVASDVIVASWDTSSANCNAVNTPYISESSASISNGDCIGDRITTSTVSERASANNNGTSGGTFSATTAAFKPASNAPTSPPPMVIMANSCFFNGTVVLR